MFEKKKQAEHKPRDDGVELENQFIMRFPKHLANMVHESIQAGNIKDRLNIQLDQDLRYGEVRWDDQLLYAKIVDLPTVVESYKTIDNKSFYKSADICQILICKEEPEDETEKESPNKNKKKDPNKVDKKYLWPHGITPPCKNVRKRRFRKTLKKKNVETPEIEKEVKHLLRIDNEAVRVDYEIINEEDKPQDELDQSDMKPYNEADEDLADETMHRSDKTIRERDESASQREINVESDDDETSNFDTHRAPNMGVAAHDIFGEEVSTTDDEDEPTLPRNDAQRQLEDSSRLSADDSRMSDFFGGGGNNASGSGIKMEFSKSMFGRETTSSPKLSAAGSSSNLAAPSGFYDNPMAMMTKREEFEHLEFMDEPQPQYTQQQIHEKINQLTRQIGELKAQQSQKSTEIASIQNATLKQRMQETLDNLYTQVIERELELKDFENMLEQ
ncbi:hypothetical protein ACLKA6_003815 [Drosophila palustris]